MIHPQSRLKEIWDTFIVLLILLAVFEAPLRIAMEYGAGTFLFALDIIISLLFIVDIIRYKKRLDNTLQIEALKKDIQTIPEDSSDE